MAIETDLSVAPYFDDTNHGLSQNYYRVLFKPSLPVQVRELNELQSILQNQIEEFGDNILKRGTVVRGCSFSFYNEYPYIKVRDNQLDGAPVNPSELVGYYVTSSTNHKAYVLDYADGFEQTDETKTLYLRYVNSGDSGANQYFQASDVLTVSSPTNGVPKVNIDVNGTGYSNSDSVVFVSAIAVTDVTGTITVGSILQQPNTGANAVVVSVDSSTYTNKTILTVKPKPSDLSDSTKTANNWTFSLGVDNTIRDTSNSSVTAVPIETIGTGAVATATTDSAQRVIDVTVLDEGSGYYVPPFVTVRSLSGANSVVLTAQNYKSRITVFNTNSAVGLAYAFGVSEGVIYQKGHFLRVDPQTIVVSRYDQYPNNVSVGFKTEENIVDAFTDTRLLDNALGSRNATAPGADRLQLTPDLIVQDTTAARANVEFFPLVEFSEGIPYKQNQRTSYNQINDEMALRTSEQTGDYVVDPFMVAVKSTTNNSLIANTYTIAVDPGRAYIDGFRTETFGTYQITADKGIDTEIRNSANVSLNYGSYITVNNLAGSFDFGSGATVSLRSAAKGYVSNTADIATGTITAPGTQIGTARVRGLQYADTNPTGTPTGVPTSQYNLYLYDIQMNAGQTFTNVRSVYYDGATYDGIADVVLQQISVGSSTSTGAVLKNTVASDKTTLDKLIFNSGFDSPLSINNISYIYRKFDDTGTNFSMSNSGVIVMTLSGNEYFPYNTDLTSSQKSELVFYPLSDAIANQTITGTVSVSTSSNVITGTSTTFVSDLQAGDYIIVPANSSVNAMKRVVSITNSTSLTVDSNVGYTNSSTTVTRVFPKYIPLPILTRNGITANATIDSQTLNIDMGTRFQGSSNVGLGVAFNILVSNSSVDDRIPNRNLFVKIAVGNNTTGFGYSSFGNSATASFTSGSASVTGTGFSIFYDDDPVVITSNSISFNAIIDTVADDTDLTLTTAVNFTGSGTIRRAVNSNGPWCLGIPDAFRLRAVYLANSSSVNVNSFDVTRDFYIDHNQNPNFYDLSYLVKKRDSALILGPQDFLLVQFDAFTQTYEGRPVTINSYVSPNSSIRTTKDSANLASLTSVKYDVNTFEVPELFSAAGTNYDLISYIDFRPRVANSAVYTNSSSTATINPPYVKTFTTAAKNFPTPDSVLSCDVEYFLGRVDSVYVDSSGKIGVNRGHPTPLFTLFSSNVDDLVTPVKNKKVLVLNNVRIPPYPNLEEFMDEQLSEIVNKNVINEKLLTKRQDDKVITRLFTQRNIEVNQPRRYTMEQIGNLERRINDLEYYVALTNLELQIKDLNLPSSANSSINRFKFGFYADNYDDVQFTDLASPEFKALIENGRVVPMYEQVRIVHPAPVCEFTDFAIVDQPKVTGNPPPAPPPPGQPPTPPPPVAVCVNTAVKEVKNANNKTGTIESTFLTMASALGNNSGQVTVYCYFYGAEDRLRIYQSNSANSFGVSALLSTNSSVAYTNTDINYLKTLPWFSEVSNTNLARHTKNGEYLKYGAKLTFTHNPARGRHYKFETTKGSGSYIWRYRVEYPINVDCNANTTPTPNTTPINYVGTITVNKSGDDFRSNYIVIRKDAARGEASTLLFDRYRINATGLKPSTLHKVYVEGKDVTNLCDSTPSSTFVPETILGLTSWDTYSGTPFSPNTNPASVFVMTDTRGQLDMFLYFPDSRRTEKYQEYSGGRDTGATYTESNQGFIMNPKVEIRNTDKTSQASLTIAGKIDAFVMSGFGGAGGTQTSSGTNMSSFTWL